MQKMETYREALAHAWRLTWKHKKLWALGLLAGLVGSGSAFMFVMRFYYVVGEQRLDWMDNIAFTFSTQGGWLEGLLTLVFLLIALFIFLFFLAVFVSAQGSLVQAVEEAETERPLRVVTLFHHGRQRVGRLLIINIVRAGIAFGLLYLAAYAARALAMQEGLWASAVFLIVSIIIIVLGLAASFLAIYAVCYVSLHDRTLRQSLFDAWALFVDHALVSLEMSVVLFAVAVIFSVVGIFGMGVISIPMFMATLVALAVENPMILAFTMAAGFVLLMALVFWLMAVYTTFAMSSWTVLFMQMSRHGFSSRMMRWLRAHRAL